MLELYIILNWIFNIRGEEILWNCIEFENHYPHIIQQKKIKFWEKIQIM